MKHTSTSTILILFFGFQIVMGQTNNVAERLGYPKESKLLIIHADDLGVSHSENMASIKAMEEGYVNSASIMVPCPWFPEIAEYAKNHPDMDFGLHLTITSEWKFYKWGPSTSKDAVYSLINEQGYFYDLVPKVAEHGEADQVEVELRRQVQKALDAGINVTHLDAHMGAVMATPEFLEAYIKVGKDFNVPVLLDNGIPAMSSPKIKALLDDSDVIVDAIITAMPSDFKTGMKQFYTNTLKNMKPGLNCLLIHTAYDDEEMQAITVDHPDWGSTWRQQDFDFFTSEECKTLLKENNIQLVTWREIRDKITRAE